MNRTWLRRILFALALIVPASAYAATHIQASSASGQHCPLGKSCPMSHCPGR
jgi:hypothetical protein